MKILLGLIIISAFAAVACVSDAAAHFQTPKGAVRVIGHRGASGYAPENTMASFKKAYDLGADMIEFDVHRTLDGELVVIHDATTDRTTGVKNAVAAMTYEQIAKLDAGSFFSKDFAGEKIPTLRELLEWAAGRIQVNIEIKSDGCEKGVVELVNELKMKDSAIVTSFDHGIIKKVKELDPEIKTGALVGDIKSAQEIDDVIARCHPDAINPNYLNLTKAMVKAAHEKGLQVNVYTVNDAVTMRRLIKYGVDGIFSNYPDVLKEAVKKFAKPAGEKSGTAPLLHEAK